MDKLNNTLKINSFQRKTVALNEIQALATAALAECIQPEIAELLQRIADKAEMVNALYGNDSGMVELTSSLVNTNSPTMPYMKAVSEMMAP